MKRHIWGIVICSLAFLMLSCQKSTVDFDNGFDIPKDTVHIPVDTSSKTVNTSKYAQARIFPGLVCSDEPRVTATVNMNLKYFEVAEQLRVSVPPRPQFSTGFYAAPGELVIVDVPAGMYSLAIQVGGWTDNLTALGATTPINRDPLIYTRDQLAPGRNYIRNLYGGTIYIIPNVSIDAPVSLTFTNVCKSPDFILGQTDASEWQAAIKKSCVPWLELRGKYMNFLVPREYCISNPITDPDALMKEWDLGMQLDFYGWQGLSEFPADPIDQSPVLPLRVVMDNNPVVGYGHNGFPVVAWMDINWFKFSADLRNLKESKVWGTYHEIGHNNQQGWWSWSTLGETTNNLFIYKLAKRNSLTNPSAWPALHDINAAANQFENLSGKFATAITFAQDATAGKNFDGTDSRINDPFARLTPFLQLFEKIPANLNGNGRPDGWGFFPYLYSQTRRAIRKPAGDLGMHDYFYEALCDYTKADFQLFFDAWGIQISEIARNKMAAKYQPFSKDIWTYNPVTKTGGNNDVFYIPTSWSVISFSSEETSGEGAVNGRAARIIDNDPSTFWHSRWSSNAATPPHFIVIDLKRELSFSAFKFANRSGGARAIKNLYIDISNDNVNWISLNGSPFAIPNNSTYNTYTLPSIAKARYIRLRIPTAADVWDGSQFAAIGEFAILP